MPKNDETSQTKRVEAAFAELLSALGVRRKKAMRNAAARAAALWTDYLLAGERCDLKELVGQGISSKSRAPVSITHIGVHLVCPHHLTVAFGTAHVAYTPRGRLAGLGTIAKLVQACTARFTLQEDAGDNVAAALSTYLRVEAAVVLIEALHPCHNVPHPRSHSAHTVTMARTGQKRAVSSLEKLVLAALRRTS